MVLYEKMNLKICWKMTMKVHEVLKKAFIKAYDIEDGLITDENIIVTNIEYNTSCVLLIEVNVKLYRFIKIFFYLIISNFLVIFIVVDNICEFSFEKTKKHTFAAHLTYQLFFYRMYKTPLKILKVRKKNYLLILIQEKHHLYEGVEITFYLNKISVSANFKIIDNYLIYPVDELPP